MRYLDHTSLQKLPISIDQNWPVFFLSDYAKAIANIGHECVMYFYDEASQALMPCKLNRKNIFSSLQIIIAPHHKGKEISPQEQLAFFNKVLAYCRQHRVCDRFIQPEPTGYTTVAPEGSTSCAFGTYRTLLQENSEEEILNSFKTKFKQGVSASIRMDAICKFGREYFSDFYEMYSSTMQKANMPVDSVDYFNTYFNNMSDFNANVAVVYDQEHPVGGVFYLCSKHSAYITHAGSNNSISKNYGAVKHLHYSLMCHLKKLGVHYYDFAGVRINNKNPKLDGVFRFKEGFGGELYQGYLWKINILPIKTAIYLGLLKIKLLGKDLPQDIIEQQNT